MDTVDPLDRLLAARRAQLAHDGDATQLPAAVDDRMRSTFGDDFGLVVDTNIGQGMKITLRVPKFRAGIRV